MSGPLRKRELGKTRIQSLYCEEVFPEVKFTDEHFADVVQDMWSTFEPIIPHSILPSVIFGSAALTMIILVRSSSTHRLFFSFPFHGSSSHFLVKLGEVNVGADEFYGFLFWCAGSYG